MPVIKMNMKQYAKYRKKLAERFMPAAMRGALSAAKRAVVLMQDRTRTAPAANPAGVGAGGAVNTGRFLQAWKSEQTSDGARVFNDATYAPIIEYGRRPGSAPPPSDVIARWAQRRMGIGGDEARSIAFVIARDIGRRGLIGRKIAEGAVEAVADIASEEIRRELDVELAGGA